MNHPQELLELLARHERAIGRLYGLYASKLPGHRELFSRLAAQEEGHARMLEQLGEEVAEGELCHLTDRFQPNAIETALAYVEGQLKLAREDAGVSARQALAVARDMENALLESKWFEVFESDSPEIRATLERLSTETIEHRQSIQQAWMALASAG